MSLNTLYTLAISRLVIVGSLSLCATTASAYEEGFTWKRSADYKEGTTAGSSEGNPMKDSRGNEVWTYGWVTGGAIDSESPWFYQEITSMVWDDDWWPVGQGRWAKSYAGPGADNNGNPPIGKYGMVHDLSERTHAIEYMPIVSWSNPTGSAARVDLSGSLTLVWEGRSGTPGVYTTPDADVEVVVASYSPSRGNSSIIFSWLGQNPIPNVPYGDTPPTLTYNVNFQSIAIAPDELIVFSLRGISEELDPPVWVALRDNLAIRYVSAVPEPATWAMLGMGLCAVLVAAGRRQRVAVAPLSNQR